jgi:hypothetical protein
VNAERSQSAYLASSSNPAGGGVAEALDLPLLGEQVGDRVEDEVDEREVTGTRVVAMSPTTTGRASAPTFSRSLATMGSESSMPMTGTPR